MSESPTPDAVATSFSSRVRDASFGLQLSLIVAVGAAWRVIMLIPKWNRRLGLNDSLYYSVQANGLTRGRWFTEPFRSGPGAEHGPLTSTVLALVSWGSDPVPWQRLMTMLFGVGTVALVGYLGRAVGGNRVGLVAAGIAAIYPNLWLSDGLVMSESISVFFITLSLLLFLRRLDAPIDVPPDGDAPHSTRSWLLTGAVFGLATLGRSEVALMIPLAAIVAWWLPAPDDRRRGLLPGVVLVAGALLVMAPWIVFNLARFEEPVFLTTNDGTTLAGSYCDDAFNGDEIGGWTVLCLGGPLSDEVLTEPSIRSGVRRDAAIDYARAHLDEIPVVMAARLGRTLDLYGLDQLLFLDQGEERPRTGVWAGIVMFWILAPLAVFGAIHQRRTVRWTLAIPVIAVLFTTVAFYGAHRIRSSAEPVIVVAAAAAIVLLWDRWRKQPDPVTSGARQQASRETAQ